MSKITTKQLEFIDSLTTQLSYGRQDTLEQATKISGKFVSTLEELDVKEASQLIAYLLSIKELRR